MNSHGHGEGDNKEDSFHEIV